MTIPVTSGLFAATVAATLALLAAGFVAGRLERRDRRAADAVERRFARAGRARTAVVEMDFAAGTGMAYMPRQSSTVDVRRVGPPSPRRRQGRGRHARTVGHTAARAVAAGVRTHARTRRPGHRAGPAAAGVGGWAV